uniref:DNA-directed RNA polymerase n=1 Tax=Parastrongyloides trichosuri TaxID=131310 RepID=A0A0N4ZZA7_PARTI
MFQIQYHLVYLSSILFGNEITVADSVYILATQNFTKSVVHAIYENFPASKGDVYMGSLCNAANHNVSTNEKITEHSPLILVSDDESKHIVCENENLQKYLMIYVYGRKDLSGVVHLKKGDKIDYKFELNKYDFNHVDKVFTIFKKLSETLPIRYSGFKKIFVESHKIPSYWSRLILGREINTKNKKVSTKSNFISYLNSFLLCGGLLIIIIIIIILICTMKKKQKKKRMKLNEMINKLKDANTIDLPQNKEIMDPNDIRGYFFNVSNQVAKLIDSHIAKVEVSNVVPEVKNISSMMLLEPYIGNHKVNELFDEIFKDMMPSITSPHHSKNYSLKPGTNVSDVVSSIFISYISLIGLDRIPKQTLKTLEQGVFNWFGRAIGLPDEFLFHKQTFTTTVFDPLFTSSGGGLILSNNVLAIIHVFFAARNMKLKSIFPNSDNSNHFDIKLDLQKRFIVYMNEDQLENYESLCNSLYLHCRAIPFSEKFELCQDCLTKQIEEDIKDDYIPFLVISSFAASTLCCYDNLEEISQVCDKFNLWLHVDASYGGFSLINEKIRKYATGLHNANSILICPDRFMVCSPEISVLFTRNFNFLYRSVFTKEIQCPEDEWLINGEDVKKFLPLKLWFVFKIYGLETLRERITKLMQDTNTLKELIKKDDRLELYNFLSLGVVTFKVKALTETESSQKTSQLAKFINTTRQLLVTEFCINKEIKLIQLSVIHITKTSNLITNHWGDIEKIINNFFDNGSEIQPLPSHTSTLK